MLATVNAKAGAVQDWWLQCNGNSTKSTCLTDFQLSKFKSICSNRELREECRQVVDYTIAQSRILQGKALLEIGRAAQVSHHSSNGNYLTAVEKIWDDSGESGKFSFAVGVLPSCNKTEKQKLAFSKNLRSSLRDQELEFLKIYEGLASIPCPSSKEGFVLVAIGRVHDSNDEFEIFTLDQNKNLKIIRTAIGAGPFSKNSNLVFARMDER